jgi:H+-transporting ATPase
MNSNLRYKTIGVAVSVDGGAMKMVGIIPMLDPPREDTTWVIDKMHEAGVEVKMVTGMREVTCVAVQ